MKTQTVLWFISWDLYRVCIIQQQDSFRAFFCLQYSISNMAWFRFQIILPLYHSIRLQVFCESFIQIFYCQMTNNLLKSAISG